MNTRKLVLSAFRGRSAMPIVVPRSTIFASRLGMTNKYAHDYACEDEYHEREMTLLDAKLQTLPLGTDFRHKQFPTDEMYPAHWNDVRFNFLP